MSVFYFQVFARVSARLDPDALKISPRGLREALEKVEKEMKDVKHHEASHYFIVSGTFDEVRQYRDLLLELLAQARPRQSYLHKDEAPPNKAPPDEAPPDEARPDEARPDEAPPDEARPDEAPLDDRGGSKSKDTSLEVVPKYMKLLFRIRKDELQNIESRYQVELAWSEGSEKVELRQRPGSSGSQYEGGVDRFIDLYQRFYPDMVQENVDLPELDDGSIGRAANKTMVETPVVIEKCQDKWSVYGARDVVPGAVKQLKEELGLSGESGQRRPGRRGNGPQTFPAHDAQRQPSAQNGRGASRLPLQQVLTNGVTISVLQGDITSQQVDAIVNAANENLLHGGGVAGAISRKGGYKIQNESRQIVATGGPVPVGWAVHTGAGNLPCKVVIHAVGPRWDVRSATQVSLLLRSACIHSLRLAANLCMTSIALPAISSGIFGMPKDLCAKTMFDAVVEFSQSVDCVASSLRDVRFVNIDDETVGVFQKEFLNRYGPRTNGVDGKQSKAPDFPRSQDSPTPFSKFPKLPPSEKADASATRPATQTPGQGLARATRKDGEGSARDPLSGDNDEVEPTRKTNMPRMTEESGCQTDVSTSATLACKNSANSQAPAASLAAEGGMETIRSGNDKHVSHQGSAASHSSQPRPRNAPLGRGRGIPAQKRNLPPPPGLRLPNAGTQQSGEKSSDTQNANEPDDHEDNSGTSSPARDSGKDVVSSISDSEGISKAIQRDSHKLGVDRSEADTAHDAALTEDKQDPAAKPEAGNYAQTSENPRVDTLAFDTPLPEDDDEADDILVLHPANSGTAETDEVVKEPEAAREAGNDGETSSAKHDRIVEGKEENNIPRVGQTKAELPKHQSGAAEKIILQVTEGSGMLPPIGGTSHSEAAPDDAEGNQELSRNDDANSDEPPPLVDGNVHDRIVEGKEENNIPRVGQTKAELPKHQSGAAEKIILQGTEGSGMLPPVGGTSHSEAAPDEAEGNQELSRDDDANSDEPPPLVDGNVHEKSESFSDPMNLPGSESTDQAVQEHGHSSEGRSGESMHLTIYFVI